MVLTMKTGFHGDDFLEEYGRNYRFLIRRSIAQGHRTQLRIDQPSLCYRPENLNSN